MRSLWRALAVAWLGNVASPMLMDDVMPFDRPTEERPAAARSSAPSDAMSAARSPMLDAPSEIPQ